MRIAAVQTAQRLTVAGLVVALGVVTQRWRRAEARADRLTDAGVVDLEPVIAATEDVVAALRPNGSRYRSADVAAVRVLP